MSKRVEVAVSGFLPVNRNSGFANFDNDNSCVSGFTSAISPTGAGTGTSLLMGETLTEYADLCVEGNATAARLSDGLQLDAETDLEEV
jgi:hypothetical protein